MTLPDPLVFGLAQPWIVYNGTLYQTDNPGKVQAHENIHKGGEELVRELTRQNYIELGGLQFPLFPIEPLQRLDNLYFNRHSAVIETYQQNFMREAAQINLINQSEVNKELEKNKVLALLVTKVLPNITNFGATDQIEKLIEEEKGIAHNHDFIYTMAQNGQASRTTSQSTTASRSSTTNTAEQQRINRQLQQESETRKRTLVDQINREYRALERPQQTHPALTAVLNPTIEHSIFADHIVPNSRVMMYQGLHDLVTPKEYVGYFEGHIERRFYQQLVQKSERDSPEQIYQYIKANKEKITKNMVSRLLLKFRSSVIKLEGNYYFPIKTEDDVAVLKNNYKRLLEKQIKLEAIDNIDFQTEQMRGILQQREQLSQVANLTRFELNGAGYEQDRSYPNKYWVYVSTGPFCLKSPHKTSSRKYIEFPSAKVGISVEYDTRERNFVLGNPVVMNSYRHPFLQSEASMQQICLGQYSPSSARRLPTEQAVMTLLSKAKENILMGYRSGRNPYKPLTDDFWRNWITKEDAERKGLPCMNDFSERVTPR